MAFRQLSARAVIWQTIDVPAIGTNFCLNYKMLKIAISITFYALDGMGMGWWSGAGGSPEGLRVTTSAASKCGCQPSKPPSLLTEMHSGFPCLESIVSRLPGSSVLMDFPKEHARCKRFLSATKLNMPPSPFDIANLPSSCEKCQVFGRLMLLPLTSLHMHQSFEASNSITTTNRKEVQFIKDNNPT